MEEVQLRDRGGIQPDVTDIMSDELVDYLDGINPALGSPSDPRFQEFQDFMSSIAEASILKIEPDQMSSGKYDDLDLTGGEEEILDVPDHEFIGNETSLNTTLFTLMLCSPQEMNGISFDTEFCPIPEANFVLPDYKTI